MNLLRALSWQVIGTQRVMLADDELNRLVLTPRRAENFLFFSPS